MAGESTPDLGIARAEKERDGDRWLNGVLAGLGLAPGLHVCMSTHPLPPLGDVVRNAAAVLLLVVAGSQVKFQDFTDSVR